MQLREPHDDNAANLKIVAITPCHPGDRQVEQDVVASNQILAQRDDREADDDVCVLLGQGHGREDLGGALRVSCGNRAQHVRPVGMLIGYLAQPG